ncbi:MAG: hypothetical protein WBM90_05155 [Acidimicrobiia bacterium]
MNVGRLLVETARDSAPLRELIHPIEPENLTLRAASPLMMKLWGHGIQALTIRSWIFVDPRYLNGERHRLARLAIHELVHARQWKRLGFFGFLRRYLTAYLAGRRRGLSHRESYLAIPLEVEARQVELEVP